MSIVNIFDDVWIEKDETINVDSLKRILIEYIEEPISGICIPFIYNFPFTGCDHEMKILTCEICKSQLDKKITNTSTVFVKIYIENYFSSDYIYPLYSDEDSFTLFEFLIKLKEKWFEIFEMGPEDEKSHFSNLSVYDIRVFAFTSENIPLIEFSSDT